MDGENAKLMPMDNVYSYFMFLGPLERHSPGKSRSSISKEVIFAWLLIALNLFVQGTILYAIFNTIVAGEVTWRNGIINLSGKSANPFAPPPAECNPGGSLCMESNNTFSCAPPSVQLAGRWDMLDLDSDGIWTREEVLKVRENLKCIFAVDPLEVFNVFVSFLKKREDVIWLHPLVQSGKALHKHYFDFAKGDIIMCTYRNEEMCPNLLKRGFFDGPLMSGKSPRVGETIDSALNYCYELLRSGGVCERSLPSAYSVWRKSSEKQCFEQAFHKFDYKHPKTGMKKSMLEVDYMAVTDYEKGRSSRLFVIYKTIIILTFVLCMVVELNDILLVFTWVMTFPKEEDVDEAVVVTARGSEASRTPLPSPTAGDRSARSVGTAISFGTDPSPRSLQEGDGETYTIHGITTQHRMLVCFLSLIRLGMAILLLWCGTVFLLQDTDYVNLLLNGVGLVFVIEIASSLYSQLLSEELREKFENTDPFTVSMTSVWKGFWLKNAALRDLVRISCVIALLCAGMYLHYIHIAKPLSTALECACLSQGDHCFEAKEFDKGFWKTYWDHDVPDIFSSVKKMKDEHVVVEDDDSPAPAAANNFIHKGRTQEVETLKVHPSDVETPHHLVRFQHGYVHHKHRHRVVRLLNGRTLK